MIYEDLEPKKKAVIDYILATWSEEVNYRTPMKDRMDQAKLEGLHVLCKELHVNHDKLRVLLKSQILTGNIQGAIRLVRGCQDKRFNAWGHLLIAPITLPLAIATAILWAPVTLYRWVARNS